MYVVEFSNMHGKGKKSDLAFPVKGSMVERCVSFLSTFDGSSSTFV